MSSEVKKNLAVDEIDQLLGASEPSSSAVPAVADEPVTMAQMAALLKVVLQREARLEERDRQVQTAVVQRDKQRRLNAREFDRNKLLAQAQCKHEKGRGKGSVFNGFIDYSVYLHTFIDHGQAIKCRICKMTWKPGDTKEFLIQNGTQLPNHTKIGWSEAVAMTKQSTDKESSSEAPLHVEGEIAMLLQGRDPSVLSALLNSPEGKAFLERTAPIAAKAPAAA